MIEIAQTGVTPHTTRNGHSFIKAKLKENVKNGYFAAVEESAHYYMCFPYNLDKITNKATDFAVTESTLFYALLTARCYKENPALYKPEKKETVFREREWSVSLDKNPKAMEKILKRVSELMKEKNAVCTNTMGDGSDLDASIMRINLPAVFTKNTDINGKNWIQLVQRISRSEDSLLRFEISSNSKKLCKNLKKEIDSVVSEYI